jgi:hypothetical protein
MAIAACSRCGERLGGWFLAGTVCADCRRADAAARAELETELACPRECPECGELFMAAQVTARFCTPSCRLRAATTKTRRALWVELHPALADAIEARLGPRDDRLDARLFPDSGADALRTAIAKACKAAGVPLWSPHDLRRRRVSLLHLRGEPWARIGEWVGQRNLAVTANTYTHVLTDEAELEYEGLLRV